jgi:hypothetical protein
LARDLLSKSGMDRQTRIAARTGATAGFVGALLGAILATCEVMTGASATAVVSATVLGPAETDIAAGAVTVSNISAPGSGRVVASRDRKAPFSRPASLATFRVGGGFSAAYAVTLPETITLTSGSAQLPVSGFGKDRTSGRLAADGTATFGVTASVSIPADQAPGVYIASYPVTIAFN